MIFNVVIYIDFGELLKKNSGMVPCVASISSLSIDGIRCASREVTLSFKINKIHKSKIQMQKPAMWDKNME